jgi:CRP-like cAMP-binding protein
MSLSRHPADLPETSGVLAELGRTVGLLFTNASSIVVDQLIRSATVASYAAGDPIATGRDPALSMAIVLDGVVAGLIHNASGKELAYGILNEGEVGGLISLRPELSEGLTMVAWTRAMVATWPGGLVRRLASADPGLGLDLVDLALNFASELSRQVDALMALPAKQRLARVLRDYSELAFDPERPLLRRTHLAMLMGTSREMMERVLRDFERDRIVTRVGQTGLVVIDEAALERVAVGS